MSARLQTSPAERAASALWACDPGVGRDQWVRVGMAAKAAGLSFEDFNAWSERAENYGGVNSTLSAWRSFKDGGVGEATLFSTAMSAGWSDDAGATAALRAESAPASKPKPAPRYPVADVWAACVPATNDHPYIVRKAGTADGLRVYPADAPTIRIGGHNVAGWLVVPMLDMSGALRSVQFIPAEAGAPKLNLPGHEVAGCFALGLIQQGQQAFVCEGIGAAWSASKATGKTALVAFGAGNQRKVAHAAKEAGTLPVIVADAGKEADCERTAKSMGCAWCAMPAGMVANGDLNDVEQHQGVDAVRALLTGFKGQAANDNPRPTGFSFLPVGGMLDLQPVNWLVRGYLEADSLALLFGDPGCGKSFLAIDVACAIATGSSWHGRTTTQGAVFYIAGEGDNGLARRFKAWSLLNGIPLDDAPLYVSKRSASLYDGASAADVGDAVQQLALATGETPRLIVIDTLARNFGGADENSTADMNAFVTDLDAHLKERFKACVLIVHHTGHSDKTRARGAMALKGALDAEYSLDRDESGVIRLQTTKMKDAEQPDPISFTLERVALDLWDEDGEQVFGAAPKSAAYVAPTKPGKAGRGKHQTTALQVLAELEREHAETLTSRGFDPSRAGVKVDSWFNRLTRDHDMDRRRFHDVKKTLEEQGRIVIETGDYVRTA